MAIHPVSDRFHIAGSQHSRPAAGRTIYADGADGESMDHDRDLELSHWVPNTTDPRYKADSSTEICLRYAADPAYTDVDLVVNDHVDVDGILSLFSLVRSDVASAHFDTLVQAAEMGDFLAAADRDGFRLSQELSLLFVGRSGQDPADTYGHAFDVAEAVLTGSMPPSPAVTRGWGLIARQHEVLERDVATEIVDDRFVSLVYPPLAGHDLDAALRIPPLNAIVDESVWMWPEVRNRDHGERVQLVSVPQGDGWFHDVWAPSYCWAETPNRWVLPGLVSTDDSNVWIVDHEPLRAAIDDLNAAETAAGVWTATERLTPFTTMPSRSFPVIASFIDAEGRPAPSALPPERVSGLLAATWDGPGA